MLVINSISYQYVHLKDQTLIWMNDLLSSDVAKIWTKSSITGCTWSLHSSSKVSRNLDQSRTFCYRLTVIKHYLSFWCHADSQDKRAVAAKSSLLSLSALISLSEIRLLYSTLQMKFLLALIVLIFISFAAVDAQCKN